MGKLIDKVRFFIVKQRINELRKAIARDPQGFLSDVAARRSELELLEEELREYEEGYS
jgi:hypothetical protein